MTYKKVTARHTQPTAEEVEQMVVETNRLIDCFRPIARLQMMINLKLDLLGADKKMQIVTRGRNCAIYNWMRDGRIPYHYVEVICQIDAVNREGFTKESLRPDVKAWHVKTEQ